MAITIEKARKVLKTYRESDYNASKALQTVGYTKQTSNKASKVIINAAIKKVAKDELKNIDTSSNPLQSLLGIVGISQDDLVNEYVSIVKQNKDLSTKLKSMLPLLKELGLQWNEDKVDVKVPVLNIITKGSTEDNGSVEPSHTENT